MLYWKILFLFPAFVHALVFVLVVVAPPKTTYRYNHNLYATADTDEEMNNQRQRGIFEEKLMSIAPSSRLMEIKGLTTSKLVSELQNNGIARVDNVLPLETIDEILSYISANLQESLEQVKADPSMAEEVFSNSLAPGNRWDLKLAVTPFISTVLQTILQPGSKVGDTLLSLVGKESELFEVASFVTVRGAGRQVIHSDTLFSRLPCLFTCTLALQDITEDMGPTVFIPGSHTKAVHKVFDNAKKADGLLESMPHVLSTLSKGSVAIYDSRTLHCGGANRSDKTRALLYFTVTNPAGMDEDSDSWNIASIRKESKGAFRLADFRPQS